MKLKLKQFLTRVLLVFFLTSPILAFIPHIPFAHATSTLTLQVSQSSDDSWKGYGDGLGWMWYTNKMDSEAGFWNTGDYMEGGGYRFQNVTIPKGSVITNAYMQYYVGPYGINFTVDTVNNMLWGEDADNATTFSTLVDFNARTYTTAYVNWTNMPHWYQNTWYDSPDISNIIQEIVTRAGWASGNSLVVFREDFNDTSSHIDFAARECYAYDRGYPELAPKLIITYEAPAGGSSTILANTPSVSSTSIGINTTITSRWSTNGTLDKYIFSWNITGSAVNDTATTFSGINSTVIKTITNNVSLVGDVIQYQIYANTTTGETNTTGLYNFTVTLPTNPFQIHGPYYEDGSVAALELNVTLHYTNGEAEVFLLNGTDGNATTFLFDPTYTPSYFSWSSSIINYTRLYYLTGLTTADINIYIPDADSTPQIYQFTISDYSGMTNPYIASSKVINGTTQYLERKPITVGTLSFLMEQWTSYSIMFSSDQGSYSIPFSAENSFLTNLNIAPLMFATPPSAPSELTSSTGFAELYNSTAIRIAYADYDNETTSVTYTIIEGDGDEQTVDYNVTTTDFNTTYPSGLYTLYWNSRESTKSYAVSILAVKDNVTYSWTYGVLASAEANPWTGQFDFLGTWPNGVDPAQLIGAIIIVLAGVGIFSYFGTGIGCGFSWIMAGILSVIGWFNLSIPMFVFSGFVTFLVYLDERKQMVREI